MPGETPGQVTNLGTKDQASDLEIYIAWKRNKSPMANPTMPEIANQNQRSIPASNGKGFPKTIQWVTPSNNMATIV
jgi:hypothetical protein